MDVGGQALCTFQRIGACWAVAGAGALYEPAKKARRATATVSAIADLQEIILRICIPPVRQLVEAFMARKKR
jgi:hypothetical protein